jgi:glycosyltransferase involved in cell wall biosynthesis
LRHAAARFGSSLLALDYPHLELVVINDRSTDRTGAILKTLAAKEPTLRVVDVTELPPHWLGKNHALQLGADAATGEFLLFTDADVLFEPTALRRAVTLLKKFGLDHLTCAPQMIGGSRPAQMFVAAFAVFFSLYARPWKARDPRSKAHVGIGAFNLIRTSLYRTFGGHAPIAMRPDDDMKLGKLVKLNGGRQQFFSADGLIRVEWYPTLREAIEGLMKNAFSGVDYSVPLLFAASVAQLVLNVWPFVAVFVLHGPARMVYLLAAAVIVVISAIFAHRSGLSWWFGFTFPLSSLLFLYILWKAAFRTLREGGIRWRDTLYPLAELRANKL